MGENKLLPENYTPVPQPFYSGDGVYNVKQLEELCKQYKEYCHQQQIIKQELEEKLKTIKGLTLRTGDDRLEFVAKIATI